MVEEARTLDLSKENHPCVHDESTGCIFELPLKVEWVKREYFEVTETFYCAVCECKWERVNWCPAQHRTVNILVEPVEGTK